MLVLKTTNIAYYLIIKNPRIDLMIMYSDIDQRKCIYSAEIYEFFECGSSLYSWLHNAMITIEYSYQASIDTYFYY